MDQLKIYGKELGTYQSIDRRVVQVDATSFHLRKARGSCYSVPTGTAWYLVVIITHRAIYSRIHLWALSWASTQMDL